MSNAISSQGTKFYVGQEVSPTTYIQVGEVQTFDGPSGQANVIDTTHLTSTAKEKLIGLPDEGQITIGGNYVSSDNGQDEMFEARNTQQRRDFKLELSNGELWLFQGYVLAFNISGGVDDKVNFSATVEITGPVSRV
jgi:hypothetical protein